MAVHNAALFKLYEDLFLVLNEELGAQKTLELFRRIIERGLRTAYDGIDTKKGPQNFVKLVRKMDESVGLEVDFPEVSDNKIVYRFRTDPFPELRGEVVPKKLDATYMDFKVSYLLGPGWTWRTTKHLWNGDAYTEHIIERVIK